MVERTEAQTWTEFDGEVMEVAKEEPTIEGRTPQWHLQFKVLDEDKEVKGKTGLIHTWVRETATTTEDSVPRDSVIEKYITLIEDVHGDEVKGKNVKEIFEFMKGKKYHVKSKILGKAFGGNQPSEYWCPLKLLS